MSPHTDPFARLRAEQFPDLGTASYLNAASLGPLPIDAVSAVASHIGKRTRVHEMTDDDFSGPAERAREAFARLIGASPEEVALLGSTSMGINVAALGLSVPPATIAVVSAGEFPANVYPWMNRDRYRVELVPRARDGHLDESTLLERISRGDVSILSLSSVQFDDGYRADLRHIGETCREVGTLFVVDAIQSLGQLPLDVETDHIDILAAGAHKWLCGPLGTGFLYVRRSVRERLQPRIVGWTGMAASRDLESLAAYRYDFVNDSRRYEVGTLPLQDYAGAAAALQMIIEAGVDRIATHLQFLLRPLREWLEAHPSVRTLEAHDPSKRSGIVSFRPPEQRKVWREMRRAGIIASIREGAIRVSPHLYNTADDVGRLLEVLEQRATADWR